MDFRQLCAALLVYINGTLSKVSLMAKFRCLHDHTDDHYRYLVDSSAQYVHDELTLISTTKLLLEIACISMLCLSIV